MTIMLDLPQGENSLIAAYDAMKTGRSLLDTAELVSAYNDYFVPAVPSNGARAVFDRFAVVDPTIRTVVRSTSTI